ncbi:MAG: hypothetical protein LKM36_00430 [Flavobacteriales bacterium]|jgi:hypothetical protein|nr:hypothetical protein [Flavobacteriales bacterium]MBP9161522.1 hypothetical protein [Flavobacteriales bacterium]MCI1751365.1 hypothetical protein [Flavobacteriales bacterium]
MERTTATDLAKRLAAMRELSLQGIRAHAGGLRTAGVRDGVEYMELIGPHSAEDVLAACTVIGGPLIWLTDAATMEVVGDRGCEGPGATVCETVVFGAVDRARMLEMQANGRNLHDTGDLRTAVFYARELAHNGDRVLLAVAGETGEGKSAEYHEAVADL